MVSLFTFVKSKPIMACPELERLCGSHDTWMGAEIVMRDGIPCAITQHYTEMR